jgi:hypothetical protein
MPAVNIDISISVEGLNPRRFLHRTLGIEVKLPPTSHPVNLKAADTSKHIEISSLLRGSIDGVTTVRQGLRRSKSIFPTSGRETGAGRSIRSQSEQSMPLS